LHLALSCERRDAVKIKIPQMIVLTKGEELTAKSYGQGEP